MQKKIAVVSLLLSLYSCQKSVERMPIEEGFYISTEKELFSYHASSHKCLYSEFSDKDSVSPDISIIDNDCDRNIDKVLDVLEGNKVAAIRGNKDLEANLSKRLRDFYAKNHILEKIRKKEY